MERKTIETVINTYIITYEKLNNANLILKVCVGPGKTTKSAAGSVTADFEVNVNLAPLQLEYEWQLAFKCPDQWKWSHEAPHSWQLTSYGMLFRVHANVSSVKAIDIQKELRAESREEWLTTAVPKSASTSRHCALKRTPVYRAKILPSRFCRFVRNFSSVLLPLAFVGKNQSQFD